MESITYVGLDVHKNSITACAFNIETGEATEPVKFNNTIDDLLKYHSSISKQLSYSTQYVYSYEAGCLGYSLYYQLKEYDIECIILAPKSIKEFGNSKVKTDKRDCINIAKTAAFNLGKIVHVPTNADNEIKEVLRMRDTHKNHLKKIKQQINAFLLRLGVKYTDGKNYWTLKHIQWLNNLDLDGKHDFTLKEYLLTYSYYVDKLDRLDSKIEEIANFDKYRNACNALQCIKGIKTYTALTLIIEIGDFSRFNKAKQLSAYLGLIPGEFSSGDKTNRIRITKTGNQLVRKLLIEAAQCQARGNPMSKSKELCRRQAKCPSNVVEEADNINLHLKQKFNRMFNRGLSWNKIITAVARQLSCEIWYLMKEV